MLSLALRVYPDVSIIMSACDDHMLPNKETNLRFVDLRSGSRRIYRQHKGHCHMASQCVILNLINYLYAVYSNHILQRGANADPAMPNTYRATLTPAL